MVTRKKSVKQDEIDGRQRYVDQVGQLVDATPARIKRQRQKALKELRDSLSPAERKAIGLSPKKAKKK